MGNDTDEDAATLDTVELSDADREHIDDLTDGTSFTKDEVERVVRFARLPRSERDPSYLRNANDSKAAHGGTPASPTDGPNGSGTEPEPSRDPDCADIRRAMRDADRVTDVVEAFPDKHTSAIFRHAEGRCTCDGGVDVDPTTSPRVGEDECSEMRESYRNGKSRSTVQDEFRRSSNAVNKHIFGRCDHAEKWSGITADECADLRKYYKQDPELSVKELTTAYDSSKSTVHKHLRGRCTHIVDEDAVGRMTITADVCRKMRRSFKRDPRRSVARIARRFDTSRPTADYHIFGRCACDHGEDAAARRGDESL
jgi:hypothetical protein